MATLLDTSILSSLQGVFIFLLIWAGTYGLLKLTNPFRVDGDKQGLYSVIALCVGLLFLFSDTAQNIIAFSLPWFTVLTIVGFFMLFFAKMFHTGVDTKFLIENPGVWGFLVFFVAIIIIFGFANTIGQDFLEAQPGITPGDQITGESRPVDTFVPADQFVRDVPIENPQVLDPATGQQVVVRPTVAADQNSIGDNIILTLFHPKILGTLFLLLLGTMTILLLGKN